MARKTYLSPNADAMTLAIRQKVWRKLLQVKKPEAREGKLSSMCKQDKILSLVGTLEEKKSGQLSRRGYTPPVRDSGRDWYVVVLWSPKYCVP